MTEKEQLTVVESDQPGLFILVLQSPGEHTHVATLAEPIAARVAAALQPVT